MPRGFSALASSYCDSFSLCSDSLSLFWPVPGELMNYPNIYSVWKENTYHIYL